MYNENSFERLKKLLVLSRNANMIFDKLCNDTDDELLEFGIDISCDARPMNNFECYIENLINDYYYEHDPQSADMILNKLLEKVRAYTILKCT